ncbi:MAG: PEP-CTERM sorting domain-containing protein [Akkermansia sp.]|nr:PEP-CTERM sorting domain-containing protein [Akkermansia sp.]
MVFDFDSSDLGGATNLTTIDLTDTNSGFVATLTASSGTLIGGDWGTAKTGATADYIKCATNSKNVNLSLTFSGLIAGELYDIQLVTGVPFEGQGSWNSMNTTNEYTSTDVAFATQNIKVQDLTTYNVTGVKANEDGEITFTIVNTDGKHSASFNYAEITEATLNVPEPATASLSLLGLAALMIRRRR